MLQQQLIHPEILRVLAAAGHGARVLIADGNYPASSARGTRAAVVSLNLSPGIVTCTDVLRALVTAAPWESAWVMRPEPGSPHAAADPPIWSEFLKILRPHTPIRQLDSFSRFEFYPEASRDDHVLTIQTGDLRVYANLLLAIGVRTT